MSTPAATLPGDSGPVSRAMDSVEGAALSFRGRLRGRWGRRTSTLATIVGSMLAFVGLCVGLAVGGPVLGHAGRPVVALAGVAAVGAGALWAAKGWSATGRKLRAVVLAVTLALSTSFAVGTLTNPVVIGGEVYLTNSTQARSFRLMQELRTDLLTLAAADEYLTFDAAQAGAHHGDYAGLRDGLTDLSTKYATLNEDPSTLPDPRFATVVDQTTAAAYWAARAMESKLEVIEADNARSRADLDTHRASYAQAVLASGESLRALSAELALPLTQMGPTE